MMNLEPNNPTIVSSHRIPILAYRIEDAAFVLGIGRTLVYQLIKDGHLAVFKVGRRSLIKASELDAFLERGGVK